MQNKLSSSIHQQEEAGGLSQPPSVDKLELGQNQQAKNIYVTQATEGSNRIDETVEIKANDTDRDVKNLLQLKTIDQSKSRMKALMLPGETNIFRTGHLQK